MLYTRGEIKELVDLVAPAEMRPLLLALVWILSRGDPNLITGAYGTRLGLTQIDTRYIPGAEFGGLVGFVPGQELTAEYLDPATNLRLSAQLLARMSLIEFCGREFAHHVPAIMALANHLTTLRDGPTHDQSETDPHTIRGGPAHDTRRSP